MERLRRRRKRKRKISYAKLKRQHTSRLIKKLKKRQMKLTLIDAKIFFKGILNPKKPNNALKKAYKKYIKQHDKI